MADSHIQSLLSGLAFARELPPKAIAELAGIGEERRFFPQSVLFKEGEEHPFFYLVCGGKVSLDMSVPGRGAVRILSLGAGDLLGWSPVVGDSTMTATATAQEETTAIAIASTKLVELCEADHEIGYHIMRQVAVAMSRRLLATRLQLLDLFAETTPTVPNWDNS